MCVSCLKKKLCTEISLHQIPTQRIFFFFTHSIYFRNNIYEINYVSSCKEKFYKICSAFLSSFVCELYKIYNCSEIGKLIIFAEKFMNENFCIKSNLGMPFDINYQRCCC